MTIASPVWGMVADRWGRKPMVERAMFGGAVILLLMAFARSGEELVVLRAVQGLLRLADQYSRARLDAACSRALNFGTPAYRTIKQILKDGLDGQPDLLAAAVLEAPYLNGGRFSRTPADRLH